MSAITDVMSIIRDTIKLTDEVKRVGETLKSVTHDLREHDRRITRLEAQWETAIQLARVPMPRLPKSIKNKS